MQSFALIWGGAACELKCPCTPVPRPPSRTTISLFVISRTLTVITKPKCQCSFCMLLHVAHKPRLLRLEITSYLFAKKTWQVTPLYLALRANCPFLTTRECTSRPARFRTVTRISSGFATSRASNGRCPICCCAASELPAPMAGLGLRKFAHARHGRASEPLASEPSPL